MRTLNRTLRESDDALLPVLARVWRVNIDTLMDTSEIIDTLTRAMLDPENAEKVWVSLDDGQRNAMQAIIGATSTKNSTSMPMAMAERLFGPIRKMGAAQIERERPDLRPQGHAEALYYKGLIALGFENTPTGARPVVYVPSDLRKVLPTHKTAYEKLEESEGEFEAEEPHEETTVETMAEVKDARMADTTIVDDLTTLLAYLQLSSPVLETDPVMETLSDPALSSADVEKLAKFLLNTDAERLTFLLGLAIGGGLAEVQNGKFYPRRADARRWMEATRAEQVRQLAEIWRERAAYRELWHVPGLHLEPGGTLDSYDPAVVRGVVAGFLTDLAPRQEWWTISTMIDAIKETDPDFQRPSGDYDSWYIRDDSGEYLNGFDNWDAVEGALLEFYFFGPMHWLGLVDVAEDAARLTVYGRAFLNIEPWPNPAETPEKLTIRDDSVLVVSRRVPRIDRFQIARFTTWQAGGDPYAYRLDARGIARGAQQGITTANIAAYVGKALDTAVLPAPIAALLENWREGPVAQASIERLLVLRTTSPEIMSRIWDNPAFRRYLGSKLGDMAVIVRADAAPALRDALGAAGIQVDFNE